MPAAFPVSIFRAEMLAAVLSLLAGSASADWLGEGKPRIGFEIEHERAAGKASHANSLSLTPGLKWQEGWINRAEIQIQAERESEPGGIKPNKNWAFACVTIFIFRRL